MTYLRHFSHEVIIVRYDSPEAVELLYNDTKLSAVGECAGHVWKSIKNKILENVRLLFVK